MEVYLLLVSEVLDHDAQAANMLINEVIGLVRSHPKVDWSAVGLLWVVSDCGPHFRSYENVAHFCVTMVLSLQIKVQLMYLGEQHGERSLRPIVRMDKPLGGAICSVQAYSWPLRLAFSIYGRWQEDDGIGPSRSSLSRCKVRTRPVPPHTSQVLCLQFTQNHPNLQPLCRT